MPTGVQLRTHWEQPEPGRLDVLTEVLASVDTDRVPVDIVFAIDTSYSMNSGEPPNPCALGVVIHAVKVAIQMLTPYDRCAIVSFSSGAEVRAPLTAVTPDGARELTNVVESLRVDGGTNIWEGLRVSLDHLHGAAANTLTPDAGSINCTDEDGTRVLATQRTPYVLLLTDGSPSTSPPGGEAGALREYLDARDFAVRPIVHTFGFGYELTLACLTSVCDAGNGAFWFIPDATCVGSVFVNAVSSVVTTLSTSARVHAAISVAPHDMAGLAASPAGGAWRLASDPQWGGLREDRYGVSVALNALRVGQPRRLLLRYSWTGAADGAQPVISAGASVGTVSVVMGGAPWAAGADADGVVRDEAPVLAGAAPADETLSDARDECALRVVLDTAAAEFRRLAAQGVLPDTQQRAVARTRTPRPRPSATPETLRAVERYLPGVIARAMQCSVELVAADLGDGDDSAPEAAPLTRYADGGGIKAAGPNAADDDAPDDRGAGSVEINLAMLSDIRSVLEGYIQHVTPSDCGAGVGTTAAALYGPNVIISTLPTGAIRQRGGTYAFIISEVERSAAAALRLGSVARDATTEVALATSDAEAYRRWGCFYIASLGYAYAHEVVNNFKDSGVQGFAYGAFARVRAAGASTFVATPLAVDLGRPGGEERGGARGPRLRARGAMAARVMSSATYYDRSGGCVHGDSTVALAPHGAARARDIVRGMSLMDGEGTAATVVAVVRTRIPAGFEWVRVVSRSPGGAAVSDANVLRISAFHPIRGDTVDAAVHSGVGDGWVHPQNVPHAERELADRAAHPWMYTFVCRTAAGGAAASVMVGGVAVASLGHGVTDEASGPLGHAFLGAPDGVVRALMECRAWHTAEGVISLHSDAWVRGADARICSIDPAMEELSYEGADETHDDAPRGAECEAIV